MKKKILIIESSKAIRFLLQTVFGKKYEVTLVDDGCSAIQWLSKKELPDLIIADTQLPDMRDWELIEYLKSSGLYGDIPLIALSPLNRSETMLICQGLGIDEFYKPFNPVDLWHAAERLIASKDEKSSFFARRQLDQLLIG